MRSWGWHCGEGERRGEREWERDREGEEKGEKEGEREEGGRGREDERKEDSIYDFIFTGNFWTL